MNNTVLNDAESLEKKITPTIIEQSPAAKLPTPFGTFNIVSFKDNLLREHAAIFMGDLKNSDSPVLARIHSECLTGDTLFSLKCDCGFQLEAAMRQIAENKTGVILYIRQEGRGIGLFNKIKAYNLQDQGLDTVDANLRLGLPSDARRYEICAEIFKALGVKQINLLTNNPTKIHEIEKFGIEVKNRIALEVGRNKFNTGYLDTKEFRMGHMFNHQQD